MPVVTESGGGKVAKAAGFPLHAGVAAEADEREKLERLCRYITRPAVSSERLSLTAQGNIRYRLKTPYRDDTTDVVFEPHARFYRAPGRTGAEPAGHPHALPRGHDDGLAPPTAGGGSR